MLRVHVHRCCTTLSTVSVQSTFDSLEAALTERAVGRMAKYPSKHHGMAMPSRSFVSCVELLASASNPVDLAVAADDEDLLVALLTVVHELAENDKVEHDLRAGQARQLVRLWLFWSKERRQGRARLLSLRHRQATIDSARRARACSRGRGWRRSM